VFRDQFIAQQPLQLLAQLRIEAAHRD